MNCNLRLRFSSLPEIIVPQFNVESRATLPLPVHGRVADDRGTLASVRDKSPRRPLSNKLVPCVWLFFAATVIVTAALCFQTAPDGDWPVYGRDPGGQRFSPLTTINRNNVRTLKIAWI